MPKVSEFYGIAIYFYYREHPPPHFHARYQGDDAVFEIGSLAMTEGRAKPGCAPWWPSGRLDIKRNSAERGSNPVPGARSIRSWGWNRLAYATSRHRMPTRGRFQGVAAI
ncbi:MAG: DUF4160 domain-containing protein [Phycisphaerales bacterium]